MKFQFPIFCLDPASSRVTLGLGRGNGDVGSWWSRSLVSAEGDVLGWARSAMRWHLWEIWWPFQELCWAEAMQDFPQPPSTIFPPQYLIYGRLILQPHFCS